LAPPPLPAERGKGLFFTFWFNCFIKTIKWFRPNHSIVPAKLLVYGEQTIQLFGEKNWFFLKKALNCFDVPARYGNRMIASAGNRFGRKPGLFAVIGNFIVFPVWRDGGALY